MNPVDYIIFIIAVYFIMMLPISIRGGMDTYRWYVAHKMMQEYSFTFVPESWLENKTLLWMFYASLSKCMVFMLPGAVIRATVRKVKKA